MKQRLTQVNKVFSCCTIVSFFLTRPPFESLRFVGELLVGLLFGVLVKVALPEDLMGGHGSPNLKYLDLIVPYAVATGRNLETN